MYDVKFYQMLSEANDAIMQRSFALEELKDHLAQIEKNETTTDEYREDIRDQISENYLALQYAMELYHDMAQQLFKVKLLSTFIDDSIDVRSFNLQYEDWAGLDE